MPTSVTHQGDTPEPDCQARLPDPARAKRQLWRRLDSSGLGLGLLLTSRTHDIAGVVMGDSSRTPQLGRTKTNPGE